MNDLWYFTQLLLRRRWALLAGTVLMLLAALASLGLLALSGWFITATGLTGIALAAGAAMTLDIYRPGAGIRFFAVGRAVARYGERLVNHDAILRVLADLRAWFFRALLPGSRERLARLRDGELLNRISTDIDNLNLLYLRVLGPVAVAVLGLVLGLGLLAWIAPGPALGAALLLVPAALLVAWLGQRFAAPPARRCAEAASSMREQVVGDLQAQAELWVYGARAARLHLLERRDADYLADERRLLRQRSLSESLLLLATLCGVWLTLVIGIAAFHADRLSGPLMVAAALGVLALGEVLSQLPQASLVLGRVRWSAERLRGFIPPHPPATRAQTVSAPADATLAMREVVFRHRAGQTPCLRGVDLVLPPGERVGILGESGTGKSTLLQLIAGERESQHGCVTLGGVRVTTIDPDALHAGLALMEQRVTLFAASIAANLRVGRANASDAELWQVLEAVALTAEIRQLPDGLETWLGPGGTGLSGGQARRLALARTLLKPARIYLLDEPTEGLDRDTEQAVLAAIDRWIGECSLIVIGHDAHRFPRVDRLLSLEAGLLWPTPPSRGAPSGSPG